MRVQIKLRIYGEIPISYSYYFGSYIIRTLERVDDDLAARLHAAGPFKPYHFSRLLAKPAKIENGTLHFRRNTPATVYIAAIDPKVATAIVDAMLVRTNVQIKKKTFPIEGVEPVPYPSETFEFATLSPVAVGYTEIVDGALKKKYLPPTDPLFHEEIVQNLYRMYAHFRGKPYSGRLTIKYSEVKPRMRYLKGKPIPCFDMVGELSADEDMMRLIWDVGLGEHNAMGFGMVGVCRHTSSRVTESSS